MAHRIVKTEDFPTANLKRLWKEPYTGEIKTESILDLWMKLQSSYKELVCNNLGQRINSRRVG